MSIIVVLLIFLEGKSAK